MRFFLPALLLVAACGGSGSQKIPLATWATNSLSAPSLGGEFGRAVAMADAFVAVGSPDHRAVHIFEAQTGRLLRTLRGGPGFGSALAAEEERLFVGVPGESRVLLYSMRSGQLLLVLRGEPEGAFGSSLALSDGEILVGASGRNAGTGEVVRYDATSGAQRGTLSSPDPKPGGGFGAALSASGAITAIGAPGEGRTYLAEGGSILSTLVGAEGFGSSVAQSGLTTLVGSPRAGTAAVFEGGVAGPVLHAPVARFGLAVALDGSHAIVLGAAGGSRAFVFDHATGALSRQVPLSSQSGGAVLQAQNGVALVGMFLLPGKGPGLAQSFNCGSGELLFIYQSPIPQANGLFGGVVAVVGDLVAASQLRSDDTGTDVHLFNLGGTLARTLTLATGWGQALVARGSDLVIGAPGEDEGANVESGAIYIVNPLTGATLLRIPNPNPITGGRFGSAIVPVGNNLLVGAPGNNADTSGAAYLVDGTTGATIHTLLNPTPLTGGSFGIAVAVFGNDLYVGEPFAQDVQGTIRGEVHRFSAATGVYQNSAASPDASDGDNNFGCTLVAVAGELWVGAPGADITPVLQGEFFTIFDAGRVYIFDQLLDFNRSLRGVDEFDGRFGEALSGSLVDVAVGAPGESAHANAGDLAGGSVSPGAAYIFDRASKQRHQRRSSPAPTSGGAYGAAVAVDPSRGLFFVGAPREMQQLTDAVGHVYGHSFGQFHTLQSPIPEEFGQYGEFVALVNDDTALIGAPQEQGGDGKAYLVSLFSNSVQPLFAPSGPGGMGAFGRAVTAVGFDAIVGEPNAEVVHVFDLSGNLVRTITNPGGGTDFGGVLAPFDDTRFLVTAAGGSTPLAYLMHVNGTVQQTFVSDGSFGWGFDIVEAGGRICISAINEDGPGGLVGSVHVFDVATGSLLRKIFAPDPAAAFGQFGLELASFQGSLLASVPFNTLDGAVWLIDVESGSSLLDLTHPFMGGGGFGRGLAGNDEFIFVGAYDGGSGGEVFVFDAFGSLERIFESPNAEAFGAFGHTLAAGALGFLSGAFREDVNPTDAGRAYFFGINFDDNEDDTITLESPDAEEGGGFGTTIAFAADTLTIGAPGEDGGRGRVYQYGPDESDGAVLLRTIDSPNPTPDGSFGFRVVANALFLGVGAPGERSGSVDDSGRAYLMSAMTGSLLLAFETENPEGEGGFGDSIAVAAANVAVGAPGEDAGRLGSAGRVYYFDCVVATPLVVLESPTPTIGGGFGAAVATVDTTVYVGAPGERNGDGVVYCFDGLTGVLLRTIDAVESGGAFGRTLHLTRDGVLVVAAPDATSGGIDVAGRVHAIDPLTGATLFSMDSPNPQMFAGFGLALASNDEVIAVGAPFENGAEGTIYAYLLTDGTLDEEGIQSDNPEPGGLFGASIAGIGESGAVGAPGETVDDAAGAGRAYIDPGNDSEER